MSRGRATRGRARAPSAGCPLLTELSWSPILRCAGGARPASTVRARSRDVESPLLNDSLIA
jgi:hypothetical protein